MRFWYFVFLLLLIFEFSNAQTITFPGTQNLCPFTIKILTASNAPSGSTFQWKKDGTIIAAATLSTYEANTVGTYEVIVTTSSNPTTYPALVLSAATNPSVNFTFTPSGDCANVATNFTNTTIGNSPNYLWDFNDPASGVTSNASTSTNPSRTFTGSPGNGILDFNVKLTATDLDGCIASITQVVRKKQLPNTDLTGTTGKKIYNNSTYYTVCNSSSGLFSFTNASTTSSTNSSYKFVWGNSNPDFSSGTFTTTTQTYNTGVYNLTYSVTGGNGCIATETQNVFVGTNPSVGTSNPGGTNVCSGQSLTFPINNTVSNTPGTIYTIDFGDNTSPVLLTHPAPSDISHTFNINSCGVTSSFSNNSFFVRIVAANACNTSTGLAVPIYISTKPVAALTISPSNNVCANTSVTFTGNGSSAKTASSSSCTNGSSVWVVTPSTGFTIQSGSTLGNDNGSTNPSDWTPGSDNLVLRFNTAGTYSVKLKIGNSSLCGSDEITKTVCVNAIPTAAFTIDQNIGCSNLAVATTNTSSAATCGTNSYNWTVGYSAISGCAPSTSNYTFTSGNATFTNPQLSFINPGIYTLGLVNTVTGGCISPQVTKTITVKAKPLVTLNASSSICVGNTSPSANVGACSETISAYAWTLTGASPATANVLSPGTINYPTSGSYTIALDVTNECGVTSVSSPITVKSVPDVTVPGNQVKCAGATSSLLNFSGSLSGTTYTWTNNAIGIGLAASGSGSSIPSFTLTNATALPIVATINVVPISGGCSGPASAFSITVNPKPSTPTVTSPVNYCQNSVATQLTATAGSGNTLMWYNNSGLTGGSVIAPTPITSASGTTNYYVTQTNTSSCTSNSSNISVVVTAAIGNNIISADQTICAGTAATSLTGTTPTGGNGIFSYQWQSSLDGGITWNNASGSSNSGTYSPGAITVTTMFRRNINSGFCSQISSNVVSITVQSSLTNTAIGSNQDICEGNSSDLLIGQLSTGGSGTNVYQWESSLNNISWTTILGAVAKDYQPPILPITTYYRRIVSNGSCFVSSSSVKLIVNKLPTSGTMSAASVNTCNGSNVTLSTSGYTGTIKKWQYNFTPANTTSWIDLSGTSATVSFSNVQQSFNVRVIVMQDGPCNTEAIGPEIPVTVNSTTVAGTTGTDLTVCTNSNGAAINLTGQTGSVLRWETSINSGGSWTLVSNTTSIINYLNLTTTTWYRAIVQSGLCPQATSTITKITVVPTVTQSNAGVDQSLCALTAITLNGNSPTVGNGTWSQVFGPSTTIVNPLIRNTQVNGLQPGQTYQFKWLITGPGTCPSSNDIVQIISTPSITQSSAGNDILVCTFAGLVDSVRLNGNIIGNPPFETSNWAMLLPNPTSSNPLIRTVTNPTSAFIFDKTGIYKLIHTINNGACLATKDTVIINVFDKPVVGPLTASAITGCVGNSFTISSGSSLKGDIFKWQYNFAYPNPITWKDTSVTNTSILFTNMQQSFDVRLITVSKGISSGCSVSDTNRIPIEVIPDFTNVIDTSSFAICPGQTISITGQLPSGAYNVFQYQWQQSANGQNGWTNITGQTFNNLNMTPLTSLYLRRVVIVSQCSKTSAPAYVFVRPSVGNFLVSDSVGSCFPFDVTFTNLVLPSTLTTWNFGDGAFNQGDQITHTYNSTGKFQVTMTAQYPGGCKFEATKNILITGPTGILKYDYQAICVGNPVNFEVASVGIDSVRWNFGNGISQITTGKTIYHTYNQAGPYVPYIELLAGPGAACRSRINGLDTIRVDQVKAGFRQAILQECGITKVAYTDTSRAFYGILSRNWDLGDGSTSTEVNPARQYFSERTWNIREIVTGNSGCKDTVNKPLPLIIWDIPQIKTNKVSVACVGQLVPFVASVFSKDAIKNTIWTFSNGLGSSELTAPKIYDFPGSYVAFFVANTINDCSDTVRLPISIYPKLQIDLGPDLILTTGTLLPLISTLTNGPVRSWSWTPDKDLSCYNCSLPIATIKKNITYVVNAETQFGCKATDSISIKVFCQDAQVFIPNLFTPDGDGLNDILMVRASGIRIVKSFRIFNRWGQVVFEKSNFTPNDKNNGWNGMIGGKYANPDVYVYTCEVICENEVTYTYKGNITLAK
jgi:gliding motility-associated-like protein